MAATQNPAANSCSLTASARSASPSTTGWMGERHGSSRTSGLGRAAPQSRRELPAPVRGASCSAIETASAARAAAATARRQRRGVDVAARRLQQPLDAVRIGRDEGAEAAECLAQRADQNRHGDAVQIEVFQAAAAGRAHHAQAMRVIHDQAGIAPRAAAWRQLRQRRQVAVHAEHAVGYQQSAHPTAHRAAGPRPPRRIAHAHSA